MKWFLPLYSVFLQPYSQLWARLASTECRQRLPPFSPPLTVQFCLFKSSAFWRLATNFTWRRVQMSLNRQRSIFFLSFFFLWIDTSFLKTWKWKGFGWQWMIEAHKGRHHNSKGTAAAGPTLLGHWDANNVADKSYANGSSEAAGHQRAPLFDWESSPLPSWSSSMDSLRTGHAEHGHQRIQEVTTTLGQTAFLHCRVRYLADRRVSFHTFIRFWTSFIFIWIFKFF